jgi:hypothetical protein
MKKTTFFYYFAWLLIGAGSIICFWFLKLLLADGWQFWDIKNIDLEKSGQFGDYVGGFIGTLFSLAGFIFLFLNLKEQREAFRKERFETIFFDLLKIHRENVDSLRYELTEGGSNRSVNGREVIQHIVQDVLECRNEIQPFFRKKNISEIYEYKYFMSLSGSLSTTSQTVNLLSLAKINIAYLIVFFGTKADGRLILESMFNGKYKPLFFKPLLDYISMKPVKNHEYWKFWEAIRFISDPKKRLKLAAGILQNRTSKFDPTPFSTAEINFISTNKYRNDFPKYYGGNQYNLGHYFRHIYQSVTYVDGDNYLKFRSKYFYVKTLRTQFSTHEQILFFFNSLSFLGMVWELTPKIPRESIWIPFRRKVESKKLITKYKLIKNIPYGNLFGIKVTDFYPKLLLETSESYLSPRQLNYRELKAKLKNLSV